MVAPQLTRFIRQVQTVAGVAVMLALGIAGMLAHTLVRGQEILNEYRWPRLASQLVRRVNGLASIIILYTYILRHQLLLILVRYCCARRPLSFCSPCWS